MTRSSEFSRAFVAQVGLSLCLLLLGCERGEKAQPADSLDETTPKDLVPPSPTTAPEGPLNAPGAEADEPFADLARNAHSLADLAQSKEEMQQAARKLRSAYEMLPPTDSLVMREVGEDLAARAARLYLKLGDSSEAKSLAQKALDRNGPATVGRANLLVVLADAEQALGNQDAARDHLMSALATNQELLKQELENP